MRAIVTLLLVIAVECRTRWLLTTIGAGQLLAASLSSTTNIINSQHGINFIGIPVANAKTQVVVDPSDIYRLKRGLKEIQYLLDNWDEKTTYCNFGEFKRELLDTKNKQVLLDSAAKLGLLDYDKSATMNVKCRSDPEVVRAFLGLTQENLLLTRADDLMRKQSSINRVNEDNLEDYLAAIEDFSVAVSTVDVLGYTARTDFSSTETQSLEEVLSSGNNKLKQSKDSVIKARDSLQKIIELLRLD
jgi:hypothetical protein